MNGAVEILSLVLAGLGAFFFLAGTVALVRLPDLYSRLHALTKADNVGLGFVVVAVMLHADGVTTVVKLGAIWLLALTSGASVSFLLAEEARRRSGRGRVALADRDDALVDDREVP